ncbi:Calcineurin-like phosphoesterase [Methyloligella halotolerans]|uniref:Calcineurin-like phosphoesterase n=1 Tax=Methyloligella halotolerans TaxID=1177755 RepID=A0A1E2RXP3_9HYPH|nr:metallophosphoesterase [Methyloligella halotolerans]ODA66991.1 Calcineurin-like phosphoesterase [Methyloligella halotolerans]
MFKLAHLSDIHLSPIPHARRRDLLSKRIIGYVNWHRGRKLVHRRDVLDMLTRDMLGRKPDHIAVTGDLVNLGLPEEFKRAAEWLKELGPPDDVTAIPGNHDAYVRLNPERGTGLWQPYMESNPAGEELFPTPPKGFPFVRRYGDIALIALSSAIPTMPFLAAGRIGSTQRRYLAEALTQIGKLDLFRIVLIHHPPVPGLAPWRRALRDRDKIKKILVDCGAELVLHGHNHEGSLERLETVSGTCSIVGVPSASEAMENGDPAAGYNEYCITRLNSGWQCEMAIRAASADGTTKGSKTWESKTVILR